VSGPDDVHSGTWTARPKDAAETWHVRNCRLEVVTGPDSGRAFTLGTPAIVIGRAGTDVVLSDRRVSAMHAEIRLNEDGYLIRDLGSTNGTRVGGVRVVEAFLSPGALVEVGDSVLRFQPLGTSVELALWQEPQLGGMVGRSPAMRRLFERIDRVAATESTVLIAGETGTGKELVAEAIHDRSPRARGPFVVLDCGAIAPALFEDQLFGHEAGAFTNATRAATGLFEAASGGTLFIDEIAELPLDVQPKLLRAVETRAIRRIGGINPIQCDVRLVAATHVDLAAAVNRKAFRADLYYRIAVTRLELPPLRERMDDLPLLAQGFWNALTGRAGAIPEAFLEWADRQRWPGNVRELKNAVERWIASPDLEPQLPAVGTPPPHLPAAADASAVDLAVPFKQAKQRVVDDFDRRYVTALLEAHGGNISNAARAAGLDRMSIYKLPHRLGLGRRGGP
jgi:DNA-binding NtrC family response regulator